MNLTSLLARGDHRHAPSAGLAAVMPPLRRVSDLMSGDRRIGRPPQRQGAERVPDAIARAGTIRRHRGGGDRGDPGRGRPVGEAHQLAVKPPVPARTAPKAA
jgi:hypothetical protein